jgi:DNA-directed RNA polymerase subunit L
MNPSIANIKHERDDYHFTLRGINVSVANALRRTLLTDIPMCVIQTDPEVEPTCEVTTNTSRFHNEIIKHRLSCIPVHVSHGDLELLPTSYELVVDVSNTDDKSIDVTTADFQLRNRTTGKFATKEELHKIFPLDPITRAPIVVARLRAKISESIPGEQLSFVAPFAVSSALVSSAYNAVCKCAYKNTPNLVAIDAKWSELEAALAAGGADAASIAFDKRNFYVLDAQRYYDEDSFDFVLQTVGVHENTELVRIACAVLQSKFAAIKAKIDADSLPVGASVAAMANCYDVTLENEDYTVGKVLEFVLYDMHYLGDKSLVFCGFKKFHPHDTHSVIRVAFEEKTERSTVIAAIAESCDAAIAVFAAIAKMF